MYICGEGNCEVEKNEQGHDIWIVTGMCVKMLNFSNEEFVETACVSGTGGLDDIFEKPGDHVNSSIVLSLSLSLVDRDVSSVWNKILLIYLFSLTL